ncbi:MAG: hydrogenase-4 component G [Campylobacteraceae bacterium]|nr:hydrogenase-4 component G [Campylobacteraceae bacterium]
MTGVNLEQNPYVKAFTNNINEAYSKVKANNSDETEKTEGKNDSAFKVNISSENVLNYLNSKAIEHSNYNSNAQGLLDKLLSGNTEALDFLSGKDAWNSNLKEIGYDGKAITELSSHEAKDLLAKGGFFSIDETSLRVSSFVISLSNDNIDALQESRKGIVQGFKEAEKMWGGELPDISYKTQEKTLEFIDKKIAELIDKKTKDVLG